MRDLAWARWLAAFALPVLTGCAENSMVMKGQIERAREEQVAISRQREELQGRATRLDRDNQDLVNQLTQAKQQAKILEDRLNVVRDQLSASNAQLARVRDEKKSTEQKVSALSASLQRQGGTPIMPNNSLAQTLPSINVPDVYVRRDGDAVRIELPAHRVFEPNGARLLPGTSTVVLSIAAEVLRTYPNQMIGIEGHADTDTTGTQAQAGSHLSIQRAVAVYDTLVNQGRVNPSQFFVAGHGGNKPVLSNATPTGKKRNARVELVVYPDTVPGK